MLRGAVSVLSVLACTCVASHARADGLMLAWERSESAASCADAERVRLLVEETLGEAPFVDEAEATRIVHTRADGVPGAWTFEIQVQDVSGDESAAVRRIESDARDCAELDGSVALVIALLVAAEPERPLHPVVTTAEPEPLPEPEPESAPEVVAPVDSPVAPPPPSTTIGGVIAAGGALSSGLLGDPAFGVRFAGAIDLGGADVALELAVIGWPTTTTSSSVGSVDLDATTGSVGACGRALRDRWVWIEACGGVLAGVTHAVGRNVGEALAANDPAVALEATVRATVWAVGPLGIRLTLGLDVPLVRTRWEVSQSGVRVPIATTAPVAAALALELVLRLGDGP